MGNVRYRTWIALNDLAALVRLPWRVQHWLLMRAANSISYPDEEPNPDPDRRPF